MTIRPTPITAALAGVLAAIAWPLMRTHLGGGGSGASVELIIATIVLIALPAHALVVGFRREASAGAMDTALLKRVGIWLAAAAGTVLLRSALGW